MFITGHFTLPDGTEVFAVGFESRIEKVTKRYRGTCTSCGRIQKTASDDVPCMNCSEPIVYYPLS